MTQRPLFDPDRILPPADLPQPRTFTVGQLNAQIHAVLTKHLPSTIHLIGQVSNFSRATSGHLYLTLKDETAEIRAVMWKSAATGVKFDLKDGIEVIATGHVDVYEERGQCQFYIRKLEPRGVGALELAFRQLHDKLAKEGLFDAARKKPIPRFPRTIAVVTSSTGAAIRDILQTLHRRYRSARVLVHPVQVQGEGAAADIADAIRRLNQQAARLGGIDVMIVGRGGGSIEDLWAFNEEVVARAIAGSAIPIIAGIGHEVDTTIADLVADRRAATPTAAAELAVPVLEDLLAMLAAQKQRLQRSVRDRLTLARSHLLAVERVDWLSDPMLIVERRQQRLDDLTNRLHVCLSHRLQSKRARLHELEVTLAATPPLIYLKTQSARLADQHHRLRWAIQRQCDRQRQRCSQLANRLAAGAPAQRLRSENERIGHVCNRLDRAVANRIRYEQERIERQATNLVRSAQHRLEIVQQALESLSVRMESTSYHRTLARGFTITRRSDTGELVTRADAAPPGTRISTQTADGSFESEVVGE